MSLLLISGCWIDPSSTFRSVDERDNYGWRLVFAAGAA
jgi:hypothetical protein